MKLVLHNLKEVPAAAVKITEEAGENRILAFYGGMGVGKTTIIKAICESLGATDIVSSPTFTLVNEYRTTRGEPLYHIDFYRIKKPEEIFDFGIEEYFSSGSYCFLEWPELIEGFLPGSALRISISVGSREERIVEFL